ncbi:MAG: thiamine-phosphate kinase [Cyanobacteria bacterium SBLK]|nr:thiamine-phosphate kinase [Cyanobacteria bacterium SBLK]
MDSSPVTVGDLGEQKLLQLVQGFCNPDVVGDDGAILALDRDRHLVVTTDVLVENTHFSDRTTSPFDVGWRSAAANLSDLAAMGATPVGLTIGLSLPPQTPVAWVEGFYEGFTACGGPWDASIIGGDLCKSSIVTVSVTALGQVSPVRTIRRSVARPGDAIMVTGEHGKSKAGLELLLDPVLGESLPDKMREALIQAHQRPVPRLDVLPHLQIVPDSVPIAGMDSSDGLADAIVQICRESGVGAAIDLSAVPISEAIAQLCWQKNEMWERFDFSDAPLPSEIKAMIPGTLEIFRDSFAQSEIRNWVFYGGEDFELVLCLPQPFANSLVYQLGGEAKIIGKITSELTVRAIDPNDTKPPWILEQNRGFQHF